MKKLLISISVILMLLLSGCGGDNDGINTVDNSLISDGETSLGYYGESVIFGNHTVVGEWKLIDPVEQDNPISVIFSTGGEGIRIKDTVVVDSFDFGVSKDGRSILIYPDNIELYLQSVTTEDCYDGTMRNIITNETSNIDICVEALSSSGSGGGSGGGGSGGGSGGGGSSGGGSGGGGEIPGTLTFENNTPVSIPDDGTTSVAATSKINVVNATKSISKVTVTLDITHTWISDIIISLISPSGTDIILSNVNIPYASDYSETTFDDDAVRSILNEDGNITGVYSPVEPLASFDGENSNGIWTLEIHDLVITDAGVLNSWSITIE